MDDHSASDPTPSSTSTTCSSGEEVLSFSENEASFDSCMEVSFDVMELPHDSEAAALALAPSVNKRHVIMDEEHNNGSIVFTVTSFPTNSTVSASTMTPSPPKVVEIRRRRRHYATKTERQSSLHSSPYAQLCWDPNQKGLVTMLEIDIINGRRKSHSRLPLDAPSPEDFFPWLHPQDGLSPSWTSTGHHSKSTISSLSGDHHTAEGKENGSDEDDEEEEDGCEPIILSGWMMDPDAMSDEESDIYWLLNDGKDVWVKIDDGCAKALRKFWKSYAQWKLKRSTPQQPGSPDAREEKRLRYSMLR
ncbi:expressed unknown protein [Seminavis robusta]|uniref:Uncharacterized protein n=1 Tax=Seminavis robusta TaxID=568900 RepID=A0A9N8H7S5_9STRA|nr:expressed unknown protein [Seminavis robusta]|eukprot:Sro191_g082120.1 n/a (304) ;mRNA; r:20854-21765